MRSFAAAFLGLLLVACGSQAPEGEDAPRRPRNEVSIAAYALPGSVDDRNWQRFVANVNAWAPEFELKMFIRGEGGPEETQLSNARRGRVQIVGLSFAGAAAVVPEIAVLSAPYLFESQEEADYIMDEVVREPFRRLFAEHGLRLLQWVDVGWVNLYARNPILEPADARGVRLRAAASVASQAFVQSVGGDMISMPFPEVLPSLQTGLIDGGVTSVTMYALSGIAQEAPHYLLTEHSYDAGVLVANKAWFDRLTPHDKDVFEEAYGSAGQARTAARAAVASLIADLEAGGATLHRPTPEQRRAWAEASREAHRAIIEQAGGRAQEIYDLILQGKRDFAARQATATGR